MASLLSIFNLATDFHASTFLERVDRCGGTLCNVLAVPYCRVENYVPYCHLNIYMRGEAKKRRHKEHSARGWRLECDEDEKQEECLPSFHFLLPDAKRKKKKRSRSGWEFHAVSFSLFLFPLSFIWHDLAVARLTHYVSVCLSVWLSEWVSPAAAKETRKRWGGGGNLAMMWRENGIEEEEREWRHRMMGWVKEGRVTTWGWGQNGMMTSGRRREFFLIYTTTVTFLL